MGDQRGAATPALPSSAATPALVKKANSLFQRLAFVGTAWRVMAVPNCQTNRSTPLARSFAFRTSQAIMCCNGVGIAKKAFGFGLLAQISDRRLTNVCLS